MEKRGFFMIGSIFPVCHRFAAFSGRRKSLIRRRTWKWVAGCGLAGALAVWLVSAQWSAKPFDWGLAASAVTRLRWPWLRLSLAPIFGTCYGRALRWAVFLKPLKPRPSMRNLLVATIIGFTAITLLGRAGKEKTPVTSQVAVWLLERICDLLMASLLLGFVLTRVQASGIPVGPKLAWVLAFGGRIVGASCLAVLTVRLSLRHFAEPIRRRLMAAAAFLPEKWSGRIAKTVAALVKGVESTRSDGALMLMLAYSVLEWALIAACYWTLAQAFSGLMGFVSGGGVIQIPGAGGGTQVVAILVLTELFGVRLELAPSFAMLLWIITFVAIVPAGLGLALKEGLDWRGLPQIGREAAG